MKIAIIGGSGKMGKWFARFLKENGMEVIIAGRNKEKLLEAGEQLGIPVADSISGAVREADVVVLSIAIGSFEEVVRTISTSVHPGQIVTDVTSVKEMPVQAMHRYLPQATILGTHPLFGPGARDITSQNFVLTPDGQEENDLAQKAKVFLESREARVTIMTPAEHDQMMSVVLGLAHFISIVAADTLAGFEKIAQSRAIGGSTYRVLMTLVESVISEDPELYATLQMNLPGVAALEQNFQKNAGEWAALVAGKDRQAFIERMSRLKDRFSREDPAFGKAYRNMYQIMEWLG